MLFGLINVKFTEILEKFQWKFFSNRQSFLAVEKNYFEEIGGKLAEKTSLSDEIADDLTSYEAYQKHPTIVNNMYS